MSTAAAPGPGRKGSRGFALVVVVWGLGLVTLLGTMAIVGARDRSRGAGEAAAIARAAAAAESGVALGMLRAAEPAGPASSPLRCTLPDGSAVRVTVTRESGKVDLNAASPALLARLFAALTRDPARGAALAEAVTAYRGKAEPRAAAALAALYRAEGRAEGPKHGPFVTPLELDQVLGVSPALLAAALPHVTVLAGRPEPDPEAATADLLALLGLPRMPGIAAAAAAPQAPAGAVTVRSEARAAGGALAVREALVSPGTGSARPTIVEWRRGTLAADRTSTAEPGDAGPCLR